MMGGMKTGDENAIAPREMRREGRLFLESLFRAPYFVTLPGRRVDGVGVSKR